MGSEDQSWTEQFAARPNYAHYLKGSFVVPRTPAGVIQVHLCAFIFHNLNKATFIHVDFETPHLRSFVCIVAHRPSASQPVVF